MTIRDVVQQAGQPLGTKQIAARFRGAGVATVQPLLDTLSALALLRVTPDGEYAVV